MNLAFVSLIFKNSFSVEKNTPLADCLNIDVKKTFSFRKQKTHLARKQIKEFVYCSEVLARFLKVVMVFFIISKLSGASATVPENPTQNVIDESGVLTKSSIDYIEKSLTKIKETKQANVYFISIRNLPYKTEPSDYAKELFFKWKLEENDIVVVLVNKLAKAGVYKGIRVSELTDEAIQIISDSYTPKAKTEQYSSATLDVNNKLISLLSGKKNTNELNSDESVSSSNFKSAKKTEESRTKYITIIAALLVIAFVVPMIQFFYYVKDE